MSTKFLSPGWRMPRNANQSKQSNYSMDFNGNSQYITISAGVDVTEKASVSFWFKTTDVSKTQVFFARQSVSTDYLIVGFYQNKILASAGGGAGSSSNIQNATSLPQSGSFVNNTWYHIVVTKSYGDGGNNNGQITSIYVNNYENKTFISSFFAGPSGISEIGRQGSYNGHFQGKLNAVSIFDYALSPSQVTTLYGNSTNGVGNPMALPSPPIAYYPLGTSAWDGNFLAENNAIGDYVFDFIPNDHIAVAASTDFNFGTGDFTISTWVNINAFGSYPYLFDFRSATAVTDNNAENVITFYFDNNRINVYANGILYIGASGTQLSTGLWYNIILKRESSTLSTHINGGSADQTATYNGNMNTTPKLNIGARGDGIHGLSGKFSNFQIFNTALSGPEIATLYNNGSPIKTLANIPQNSNLKAWYKLDASEIYNSTSTEWSVDNNKYPSAYPSSLNIANGANNKITITPSGSPTYSAYSVSVWINPTTFAGDFARIFQFTTNERFFGLRSTGAIVSGFQPWDGNELTTTAVLSTNRWYHLVFVDNGTNTIVYIDKVGETLNTSSSTGGSNWYIGNNANDRLNSKLSNVQVFNTALSQSNVNTLYNNGVPLTDMSSFSSLVSWWKLNNTTTGIQDSKGSNNGTNNGATEYAGFVNALAGDSSGMSQANLVQSDLQTVAPYSKYAMNFDGTDYIQTTFNPYTSIGDNTSWTASSWVYVSSVTTQQRILGTYSTATNTKRFWIGIINSGIAVGYGNRSFNPISGTSVIANSWQNIIVTYSTTTGYISVYINGSLNGSKNYLNPQDGYANGDQIMANANITIGDSIGDSNPINGKLSNCTIWNTVLTPSEVREVYNEGLPSNLHNFSGTAPVAWWQLGENSSYVSGWVFADEMPAGNNGTGNGLAETDLINGVGTTANGVSSGMAVGDLVGNAPYSTANALSSGMAVTARVTGSGNTP